MNTCDTCKHYIENGGSHYTHGECSLINIRREIFLNVPYIKNDYLKTSVYFYSEDGGCDAYLNVGPKFGCIHWIKKD